MKNEIKRLKIADLTMWDQNPRNDRDWIFKTEKKSEEEIIIEMLMDSRVRNNMHGLIDDLASTGLLKETLIVYENINEDGVVSYQTFDGNRRMAAFRLINYPNLIKSNGYDLTKIIQINNTILEVDCNFYSSEFRIEALKHVENRHSGIQGGEGRLDWISNNKENIRMLMGNANLSIGSLILDHLKDTANLTPKENTLLNTLKIKNKKLDKTTLDRVFGSKVIKEKFNLLSNEEYDLKKPKQVEKIIEILDVFVNQTSGKVGDVYYKKDIESVFANVKNIKPTNQQPTLFTIPEKKRRNNKYIQSRYLFSWRANGINIENETFKYLLRICLDRYETKQFDYLPEFELMVAPFLYRALLELTIKFFIDQFSIRQKEFNIAVPDEQHLIDAMNSNNITVSVVNSKKISSILNIAKRVKNPEKLKAIESELIYFKKSGFFIENNPKLNTFIDQLHDNAHGNKAVLKKYLVEFDRNIKEFILLVNELVK